MAYRVLSEEPSMRAYGNWSLTLAGLFNSRIREVKEVLYQFRDPFVMDTSKFEDAFEDPVRSGEVRGHSEAACVYQLRSLSALILAAHHRDAASSRIEPPQCHVCQPPGPDPTDNGR